MQKNPLLSKLNTEIKAYNDPVYFAENILKIKPFPKQAEMLREFYRSGKNYTHLIAVTGMRGGKTQLGAMISSYEIFKLIMLGNPQAHYGLPNGQPIFVLHVANSRDQAYDTIYAQTAGLLEQSGWFVDHGMEKKSIEFLFPSYYLHLRCDHSNSASLAGRTAKCVIMDETARFRDTQGKSSGEMVYYTVSRAVKTFGTEGKVVSISSPIYEDDFQMRLYYQGQKLPTFLTYLLPTWEMNPHITREMLEPEFRLNPETAWRDYGAKPPAAIEAFFRDRLAVLKVFDPDLPSVLEGDEISPGMLPKRGANYYMAGDPAVKNDAFGLALIHNEGDTIVTDFTHRFTQTEEQPEISAMQVKEFILSVANTYPLRSFMVDTWQYPETIQALERAGVFVKQHTVKKQEYDCLKERIYTGKIKIPENEKLRDELLQLELVHGIRIDHPRNGCLVGSTMIPLLDGRDLDIDSICKEINGGKELWTYSIDISTGKIIPKLIKHPRLTQKNASVIKVLLDNDKEIKCTPNHPFMLRDGSFKQAKNLIPGESLMPFYRKWQHRGPLDDYELIYSPLENKWHYTHRLVVGKQSKNKHVHHKNYNKHDNTPSNLQPMLKEEHAVLHNRQRTPEELQKINTLSHLADKNRSATMKLLHATHPEIWTSSREALHQFNISPEGKAKHAAAMNKTLEKVRSGELKRKNWAEGKNMDDPRISHAVQAGANARRGVPPWNKGLKLNHKVKNIIWCKEREDVFDLSIEGTENFPTTSGVFVHNSKDIADALANAVFECMTEENMKPEVWRPSTTTFKDYEAANVLPPILPIDEDEFHDFPI